MTEVSKLFSGTVTLVYPSCSASSEVGVRLAEADQCARSINTTLSTFPGSLGAPASVGAGIPSCISSYIQWAKYWLKSPSRLPETQTDRAPGPAPLFVVGAIIGSTRLGFVQSETHLRSVLSEQLTARRCGNDLKVQSRA